MCVCVCVHMCVCMKVSVCVCERVRVCLRCTEVYSAQNTHPHPHPHPYPQTHTQIDTDTTHARVHACVLLRHTLDSSSAVALGAAGACV